MIAFEELFDEAWKWQSKTFDTNYREAITGLIKEAKELKDSNDGEHFLEEMADVFMYLIYTGRKAGYSLDQIKLAFGMKLNVNKERIWRKTNKGYFQHIEK